MGAATRSTAGAPAASLAGPARTNLCKAGPGAGCPALTCATTSGDNYCGTIGDGCGNSLACAATCPRPDGPARATCVRDRPGCVLRSLATRLRWPVLRNRGDGCGNSLACSTNCSTAGSSWVCGGNNVCVGGPSCQKLSCNTRAELSSTADRGRRVRWHASCAATCANGTPCGP